MYGFLKGIHDSLFGAYDRIVASQSNVQLGVVAVDPNEKIGPNGSGITMSLASRSTTSSGSRTSLRPRRPPSA